MKKYKIFVDVEKEQKYLEEMARQGYILKKHSGSYVYHFDKKESQELNYRIDYRLFGTFSKLDYYKTMFKDFGWTHVSGKIFDIKHIFVSNDENKTEIFSTDESLAMQHKATFTHTLTLALVYMILGLFFITAYTVNNSGEEGLLIPLMMFTGYGILVGSNFIMNFMCALNVYLKCRAKHIKLKLNFIELAKIIAPAIITLAVLNFIIDIS